MARTRKPVARPLPPRPPAATVTTTVTTAVKGPREAQPVGRLAHKPAPPADASQPADSSKTSESLSALVARASKPMLAVTYWFDPMAAPEPYPLTIRFSGQRVGVVAGAAQSGDQFTYDHTIAQVVPGSGPIALTARIRDVNAGDWAVTANVVDSSRPRRGRPAAERTRPIGEAFGVLPRLWHRWVPSVDPDRPVHTHWEPYIRVPGLIPFIWGVLATIGMIVAVLVQSLVLAHLRVARGPALLATLLAIAVGIVGAKVWYIIKSIPRPEHDLIGWCIQGFITGATLTAVVMLLVLHAPLGTVLDATAPGLMLGMVVGRIGCFFAGCCGGPPTASRWGVWCSDQHIGARRVPTQLMEALAALILGLVTLLAVWTHGPAGGALFVAVVAAYTLLREGILRLRAEPLTLRLPVPVTPVVSALVFVGALVFVVLGR